MEVLDVNLLSPRLPWDSSQSRASPAPSGLSLFSGEGGGWKDSGGLSSPGKAGLWGGPRGSRAAPSAAAVSEALLPPRAQYLGGRSDAPTRVRKTRRSLCTQESPASFLRRRQR